MRAAATVGAALACLAACLTASPLHAQYFGRNKVQYRAFHFQVLTTAHFDVYYYGSEKAAAVDAARVAERDYARLSRVLQHEFRDRKPLILYASHAEFQQTNALPTLIDESTGGVTEAMKDRVIVPFTGSFAEFEHVLAHELVHAFQYDILLDHGTLASGPFSFRPTLWFMEGMAEYLSIGRIDAHTAAWVRDAVLSGYMRTIPEMSARDDYLSYRFGQSLWAYIGRRWGDDVIGLLLQRAPRMGIDEALESTLGLSVDALSDAWLREVRTTYLPQAAAHGRPSVIARRLTDHQRVEDPWYLAPALSPDGTKLVYLSQRGGRSFDLWLADARTGRPIERLVKGESDADVESLRFLYSSAAFSADGRYLAFSAQSGGRDVLHVFDVARRRTVRTLRFDLDAVNAPSWSPDGSRIVFSGSRGGVSDLYVTDLDGTLTRLTHDRFADLLPSWSPDGSTIAFSTDRGPASDLGALEFGPERVALMDVDTRRIRFIPNQDRGRNLDPVWSPDGRALVFNSDRTGIQNLYLYDLDADSVFRISDLLTGAVGVVPLSPTLSWSRRAGTLVFVSFERAGYNLYAVDDPLRLPRTPVEAEADGSIAVRGPQDRSAAAPEPGSVTALLDSAARVLPDTATFRTRPYRARMKPDVIGQPTIGAQVGGYYGNGVYGGSYLSMSDMLGNQNLFAALNLNGSLQDAAGLVSYAYLRHRANVGVSLQQVPLYRYLGGASYVTAGNGEAVPVSASVFVRDLVRSADGRLFYPFSTFRRVELELQATSYSRAILYRGYRLDTGEPYRRDENAGSLTFARPGAALVFDNTAFGWTGPVAGHRYRIEVGRSWGDLDMNEALLDARGYADLGAGVTFATRLTGLARWGDDAGRFTLFWGGPYFLRGYDGGSWRTGSAECASVDTDVDPRLSVCPARDQLVGSSAAVASAELRFPLLTRVQIGGLGSLPPVVGLVFAEGGLAWDPSVCAARDPVTLDACVDGRAVRVVWRRRPDQSPLLYRAPLYSAGLGMRLNVFFAVLRLDYAWPLSRTRQRGVFSLSFGPSF